MWVCPACGVEVEDNFEVCWGCGTGRDGTKNPAFRPEQEGIVEGSPPRPPEAHLVRAATFLSAEDAHIARNRLAVEGIPAFVMDEQDSAYAWERFKRTGGIELYVAEADLERALPILAEHAQSSSDEADEDE